MRIKKMPSKYKLLVPISKKPFIACSHYYYYYYYYLITLYIVHVEYTELKVQTCEYKANCFNNTLICLLPMLFTQCCKSNFCCLNKCT